MTNLYKSINTEGGSAGGGGDQRHTAHAPSGVGANAPTALVIGTGFGGLAAAIRLSVKGYRVQMLEKLDAPGGRAYVHKQDGFTFDAAHAEAKYAALLAVVSLVKTAFIAFVFA
jgi:monoamine oxidase